jgi:hypothetical protein
MAANLSPLDLQHRVFVTVREVAGSARRMLLKRAFHLALQTDRRIYALGIRKDGGIVMCGRSACDHTGQPSVMPIEHEIEAYANDPTYRRPTGATDLRHPPASSDEFEKPLPIHMYPAASALDWPPHTHLVPWWDE